MRNPFRVVSCLLATLLPAAASPPSKSGGISGKHPSPVAAPAYLSESPLPAGWPAPGPFNQVLRKKYPAYRAAFTKESSPNGGFWRLFKHIERNKIPMTSPVEMKLDGSQTQGAEIEEMAFLYQNPAVGRTGADGKLVEVRDVPARDALSYAWQGARDKASIAHARKEIDAGLAKQNLKATGYRLLGYNSPFVPRARQTHELQALLDPPADR